ncbi:CPBP family intramembrane glutamic endopeptidase [Nocardia transvalensis]|uniref:CPBP family intramembrane glutamic endopeptidase n=1 Tax=Nocardia transvalensis TaxID=37333 RepID=UPI001893E10F|nr:type II CAAX endopeptidase family protein [Nocardia transvalensis]MBF6330660.1 CPBP family intramembrane metalloprotease [Nocardia transvalensis]
MDSSVVEGSAARVQKSMLPVAIYVVSAFLISALLLGVQSVSGLDPAALTLPQFGPAVAAACTLLMFGALRARLSNHATAVAPRRVGADLIMMLVGCTLMGAVVLAGLWWDGTRLLGPQAVGSVPFVVFLVLQLVGAAGEEIGWRGFMQPVLETRFGRLAAVLMTGFVWALWHVQAFAQGAVVAVSFLVSVLGFAVVLGYSTNGSVPQRILVATIGHWIINVGLYVAVGDDTHSSPQIIYTAVGAVVAAAVVLTLQTLARKGRPVPAPRAAR